MGSNMTPFKIRSEVQYTGKATHFGATVLALQPTKDKRNKLDEKWRYEIWVGKSEASDENVILTEDSVMLARTVRIVSDEAMNEMKFHERVRGLPWDAKETAKD